MDSPPSPQGHPGAGNTLQFAADPFGFVDRAVREVGDCFRLDLLGSEVYILAHPDYARQVLVSEVDAFGKTEDFRRAFGEGLLTVEGEAWRRQREAIAPRFFRERIDEYVSTMAERAARRSQTWDDRIDLESEMSGLALEILFASLFGRDLDVDGDDRIRESAAGLNGWFEPTSWALPEWMPTPARRRFRRSVDTLETEADRLVREADPGGDSLLSDLVAAAEAGAPLTPERLRDQVVTFTFAGHETTAKAMTFAWYYLTRNPSVRARFHDEIDAFDGPPEDLDALPLTRRIVKETLRLQAPVHTIPRRTTEPVEMGGYHIPEGKEVHIGVRTIQRDGRFWEDPETFRPDRWEGERENTEFAYFPFGGGRRTCIGREFALAEATAVLATIGREYEFRWEGETPVPVTSEVTTKVDGDSPVRVLER